MVPTVIVIVVILLTLAAGGLMLTMYNSLVRMRQGVGEAWAGIDVELKRRHDLIPNLVQTVQGYATHERGVFEDVTRARAAAVGASGASPAQRATAENALTASLRSLFAVAERYPELKAISQFNSLSDNLTGTENKIEAARAQYNVRARGYNTAVQRFPANLMAGTMGFHAVDYFGLPYSDQREVPTVGFGT